MDIAKEQFRPSRSKGQCFLTDRHFIERIVTSINPHKGETLVEIGPGTGALTIPILEQGANVLAIESDTLLVGALQERKTHGLQLIEADASKIDYNSILQSHNLNSVRVFGNLPYSVASPILLRLLETGASLSSMTLMFQSEVAERLVALPNTKNYSFLSVVTQRAAKTKILFHVPPGAFRPKPRILSTVVELKIKNNETYSSKDETLFRHIVKSLMAQRRKTIFNNIRHLEHHSLSKHQLTAALERSSVDLTRRAESMSVEEFTKVSRNYART